MEISERQPIPEELRRAIEARAARIEVEPYYTMAMNKGLKGHAMGYWSGTGMGLLTGAFAGALLHLTAGAALAAAGIAGLPVIAGLAGIGATIGGHIGSRVGSAAGAVSGVVAEFERRMRAQQLEQEVLASPEKQREVLAEYRANPVVAHDDTISEIYASSSTAHHAFGKIVLPSTMVLTTLLCTVAGAVMAAGAFLLGGAAGIGFGATTLASALGIGCGLGAATGISFGIYYPGIFAQGAQATGNLLAGNTAEKIFGNPKPQPALAPQISKNPAMASALSSSERPQVMHSAPSQGPSTQVDASHAQYGTTLENLSQRILH